MRKTPPPLPPADLLLLAVRRGFGRPGDGAAISVGGLEPRKSFAEGDCLRSDCVQMAPSRPSGPAKP